MFAGDGTAHFDAEADDFVRGDDCAAKLFFFASIEKNDGMQVAVAGVKDVADPQPAGRRELRDPPQHRRQLGPRHDPVLDVVVGADPPHRGERRLAPPPDPRALVALGRDPVLARVELRADPLDRLEILRHLLGTAVELDDQHRAATRRVVRPERRLGRLDRDRVHHLDRRRGDPRADDPRHRLARLVGLDEAGEQRANRRRGTQDPQRQLGRDPERALGADEHAEQIGPLVPDRQLDQLTVGQHDLRRQDVVDREAVLQAVRAARVLRDVAADRADLLRGRVGRVVEAVIGDGARDVEIGDTRLDHDMAAVGVDLEHPVHPRQRDHDPLRDRQRPAREP